MHFFSFASQFRLTTRERFLVAYLTIGSWLAFTHRVMSALGSLLSNREAIRVALGDTLELLSCLKTSRVHPKLDGLQLTMNQFFHNNLVSPILLKACRGAFHCFIALSVCVHKIIEHAEDVSKFPL